MAQHRIDETVPQATLYALRLGLLLGLLDAVLSGVTDLPAGRRRLTDLERVWIAEDRARHD
jgi:hypothetical protein